MDPTQSFNRNLAVLGSITFLALGGCKEPAKVFPISPSIKDQAIAPNSNSTEQLRLEGKLAAACSLLQQGFKITNPEYLHSFSALRIQIVPTLLDDKSFKDAGGLWDGEKVKVENTFVQQADEYMLAQMLGHEFFHSQNGDKPGVPANERYLREIEAHKSEATIVLPALKAALQSKGQFNESAQHRQVLAEANTELKILNYRIGTEMFFPFSEGVGKKIVQFTQDSPTVSENAYNALMLMKVNWEKTQKEKILAGGENPVAIKEFLISLAAFEDYPELKPLIKDAKIAEWNALANRLEKTLNSSIQLAKKPSKP